MSHSFDQLRSEYLSLLSTMVVTRAQETNATAARGKAGSRPRLCRLG